MRRQMISVLMMGCGVLLMLVGMSIGVSPQPAAAMPLLQPSPRPTFVPTAGPPPTDDSEERKPRRDKDPRTARITGTIIDLRTGAPISGVPVDVGGVIVTSDKNGNYDRPGLASGYYTVTMLLEPARGVVGQPPLNIAVGRGDTVIVHLFFTSPVPTMAAALPPAPPPTSTVGGNIFDPALPPALPETSEELRPAQLPLTGRGEGAGQPWLWILLGGALLLFGAVLQLRLRVRRAAPAHLDEEHLLHDLLAKDL